MNGHTSKYSGSEIDELLGKLIGVDILINGFIRLDSTPDSKIDLNTLTNIGNFSIKNWTNGPILQNTPSSININITSFGAKIYQTLSYMNLLYTRNNNNDIWSEWTYLQGDGTFSLGSEEPSSPSENTLWFDTSSGGLRIKIYIDGKWVDAASEINMSKAIYDPTNKNTDFFKYVDDQLALFDISSELATLIEHINDSSIHITAEEKAKWNSSASLSAIDNAVSDLEPEIIEMVSEQSEIFANDTDTLIRNVSDLSDNVNAHISNTSIHPDATKQAYWDSKASPTHTHINDGRVEIPASAITSGTIPIERIDQAALERTLSVNNEAEMLGLTIDDIQNGDSIYIRDNLQYYVVIDDTKLGTIDAFKLFAIGTSELSWNNIINKPTTLIGYGITDAYDKDYIDNLFDDIVESVNSTVKKIDTIEIALLNTDLSLIPIEYIMKSINDAETIINKI